MTNVSTRNKLRWQCKQTFEDLKRAQDHMVSLYAIADERSSYINDNLPVIVVGLEEVMSAFERFWEGI